jgi:hypothetical protein
MNGSITLHLPNQVRIINLWRNNPKRAKKSPRLIGAILGAIERGYKIITLNTRQITPPSLFGTDRRISYAYKKYHSGWIWIGLTMELAGTQFSGSPKTHGENKHPP